jgi:myo-inositol-1(or 4)-monophosphatase
LEFIPDLPAGPGGRGEDPRSLREFLIRSLRTVAPEVRDAFGHTGELRFKHGREAITPVDGAVEARLTAVIHEAYPTHRVVGEEAGASGHAGAETAWYIDPIDGTLNYSLGVPLFSTSVAVLRRGVAVAGAVLDPLRDECFSAARGGGAWCNDQRLAVSRRDCAAEAIASTQSSRSGRFVRDRSILNAVTLAFLKTRRLGSIALELSYVAAGRFDALVASKSTEQNLYDVAAGLLLVEEAGGRVSNGRGEEFGEGDCELVVSNGLLHDEILELVNAPDDSEGGTKDDG